jgi:chromosome segregation ATPase
MAENESPIDVYYDMDVAQICEHFNKNRNTVDKAIAKLVKDYPDSGWKYKNPETKRITIKAEGVEKLASYFRKEKHELSTVEVELRYENEKLKAIIAEKEKAQAQIENLYKERLALELEKNQQTFLLEQKTKEQQISELESEKKRLEDQVALLNEYKEQSEVLKRKEEEYNSKSFFYRLTHKI